MNQERQRSPKDHPLEKSHRNKMWPPEPRDALGKCEEKPLELQDLEITCPQARNPKILTR